MVFDFSPLSKNCVPKLTGDMTKTLLKPKKMEKNSDFPKKSTSFGHFFLEIYKLRLVFLFQDHPAHFCLIHIDMRLIKSCGVNLSISREASHEVLHIFIQNYVEARLPDPVF